MRLCTLCTGVFSGLSLLQPRAVAIVPPVLQYKLVKAQGSVTVTLTKEAEECRVSRSSDTFVPNVLQTIAFTTFEFRVPGG